MNNPVPSIIILSYVLKLSFLFPSLLSLHVTVFFFSCYVFVWKAASLIANMTPPLPILPVSIVFPAAGVLLPLYLA